MKRSPKASPFLYVMIDPETHEIVAGSTSREGAFVEACAELSDRHEGDVSPMVRRLLVRTMSAETFDFLCSVGSRTIERDGRQMAIARGFLALGARHVTIGQMGIELQKIRARSGRAA